MIDYSTMLMKQKYQQRLDSSLDNNIHNMPNDCNIYELLYRLSDQHNYYYVQLLTLGTPIIVSNYPPFLLLCEESTKMEQKEQQQQSNSAE